MVPYAWCDEFNGLCIKRLLQVFLRQCFNFTNKLFTFVLSCNMYLTELNMLNVSNVILINYSLGAEHAGIDFDIMHVSVTMQGCYFVKAETEQKCKT